MKKESAPTSTELTKEQHDAAQRFADQGVGTVAAARYVVGAIDKGANLWGRSKAQSEKASSKATRRGGRSYNEGSDSELDSNWNVPRKKLSAEQVETNRRGAAAVRAAMAGMAEKRQQAKQAKRHGATVFGSIRH